MQLKIVNINWEMIPFSEGEIARLNNSFDGGIYQIYGYHPAYGDNSLLYIGKAGSFSNRLRERFEFLESCAIPSTIRIGRICNSNDKPDDEYNTQFSQDLLCMVEKILIKSHAPAFNKQENAGLFSPDMQEFKMQHYLILNWENFGKLLPEVSTFRYSYRFWSFDKPINNL